MKIILDLCGGSGSWSEPYRQAGYDVRLITLPTHDVRDYQPPENVHGILAAPPCTQFSKALDPKIQRNLPQGLEIVEACLSIIDESRPAWWALENPYAILRTYLGEPKYKFHPWWFGDPWTKNTALWGNFQTPERTFFSWDNVPKIPQLYTRPGRKKVNMIWLHKSAKSHIPEFEKFDAPTDADFRSLTPQKFARKFFEANP